MLNGSAKRGARALNALLATCALALATGAGTIATTSTAEAYRYMSCGELWYARNAIYAAKGYCFETPRAIAVFGPRCYPPYGRLNQREAREVSTIRTWERRKGC
ncbi:MAG: YARHG domain-containing protein [Hyphomicrobiaceae bacterium]